jgi:Relaxase/Mobilisation nuclease domain
MDVGGAKPLLDIASYARRAPGSRDHLSHSEIDLIRRTVNRAPEVMVKVLTRGGQNLSAVRAHLAYLTRGGDLEIETDDGDRISGWRVEEELLEGWNLDLEEYRRHSDLRPRADRSPPKLAHKILFSMPPGTPADKVLAAVKDFAREEFGLKHRYAMVLHTDEPHPHVHLVVKAVSEEGVRLNIRKATLRDWRREFARHLRARGVAANATDRAVRGLSGNSKSDGIYRASLRQDSTATNARIEGVASELRTEGLRVDPGHSRLRETRKEIQRGWAAASDLFFAGGDPDFARQIRKFVAHMPPPRTDREQVAAELTGYSRSPSQPEKYPRLPGE